MSSMKQSPLFRHLLIFFLKFMAVYIFLMLPPFKRAYADFFKSQCEMWFSSFAGKGVVLLREPENKSNKDAMLDIILLNGKSLEGARQRGQSQAVVNDYGTVTCNWYSYMLVAYIVALVAAVPIGWRRKPVALIAGLALAYAYMILMMKVFLLHWFNEYSTLQVLRLEGFAQNIIELVYPVMVLNPGTLVFLALLIGGIVMLKKGDWENISRATISTN